MSATGLILHLLKPKNAYSGCICFCAEFECRVRSIYVSVYMDKLTRLLRCQNLCVAVATSSVLVQHLKST
ncbi:hypothetical protein BD777DRAFT_125305 [Yarrowia lipolytica]|nr:hypothetical protein BD777DRAFT_125305 [Yarrowia lipolytica]